MKSKNSPETPKSEIELETFIQATIGALPPVPVPTNLELEILSRAKRTVVIRRITIVGAIVLGVALAVLLIFLL